MASAKKTKIDNIVDADSYFSLLIHLLFTAIWDYNICSVWILAILTLYLRLPNSKSSLGGFSQTESKMWILLYI